MRMSRIKPTADDGFLLRMCYALRLEPKKLAKLLDIPWREFEQMLKLNRASLPEIDRHDVWWELSAFVDEELAYLMVVRSELSKALQKDRAARALRIQKQRDYHLTNPRSK